MKQFCVTVSGDGIQQQRPMLTALVLILISALLFGFAPTQAAGQSLKVIHTFTGGQDGAYPYAGLIIDKNGNLYGTANAGGDLTASCPPANAGCGTVYKLAPSGSGWTFRVLYTFLGGNDGQGPYGRVAFGPTGELYGTTVGGGGNPTCLSGCGTVFSLKPPTGCKGGPCSWTETVLYLFQGNSPSFYPTGDLALDRAGDIYGTTYLGANNPGSVYELKPSNGTWTQSVLYDFTGPNDGGNPYSGVTLDNAGNIYGTDLAGGINNSGAVFELSPSGTTWTETVLYYFQGEGNAPVSPQAGLIRTQSGELIGATEGGGAHVSGGAVYSLKQSGGVWNFTVLSDLVGVGGDCGPWAALTMDAAGNLYGTTQGYPPVGDYGYVFKLTHTAAVGKKR